jgi:hypothetical protein
MKDTIRICFRGECTHYFTMPFEIGAVEEFGGGFTITIDEINRDVSGIGMPQSDNYEKGYRDGYCASSEKFMKVLGEELIAAKAGRPIVIEVPKGMTIPPLDNNLKKEISALLKKVDTVPVYNIPGPVSEFIEDVRKLSAKMCEEK